MLGRDVSSGFKVLISRLYSTNAATAAAIKPCCFPDLRTNVVQVNCNRPALFCRVGQKVSRRSLHITSSITGRFSKFFHLQYWCFIGPTHLFHCLCRKCLDSLGATILLLKYLFLLYKSNGLVVREPVAEVTLRDCDNLVTLGWVELSCNICIRRQITEATSPAVSKICRLRWCRRYCS